MTNVKKELKESKPHEKYKTLKRIREHIRRSKKALLIITVLHLIVVVGLTQIEDALERRLTADDYSKKLM